MSARVPSTCFRDRLWKRFIEGPDPALLEELYVPMLSAAIRYDRSCAYFSSSVLAAAARGFGELISNLIQLGEQAPRPAVRLIVNEEMAAEDVRALMESRDDSKLTELLLKRLRTPKELLEKRRLEMLAWLAKQGHLEIRVGVMRSGGGIVHGKFGIATDRAGDSLTFSGSGNESAAGLLANYECLEISTSWEDPERYEHYRSQFEALWHDTHPTVHTVPLPEAVRLKLIRLAPKDPPVEEATDSVVRQKAAMVWQFLLEAPYFEDGGPTCDATALVDLWPHQRRVVEDTAGAWPSGRLLCDEVGMGKTIEAILVLRRLLAGRGVRRVLVLLPAGLLGQWQGELREKGGLIFPRLEGLDLLVWPDGSQRRVKDLAEALEQDLLLMSRETARLPDHRKVLMSARPWDLVVLDEAHAARRKEPDEGEFNVGNLLLTLLRELQLKRKARGILLLSATPMQTHPWEPWDLLSVLGQGGLWLAEFSRVRKFYEAVVAVRQGYCEINRSQAAAVLIKKDPDFPPPPIDGPRSLDEAEIRDYLAWIPPSQCMERSKWLRSGSPLARRMHRNTRETLRGYHSFGLLPAPPPQRDVEDKVFDYKDRAERDLYESVADYIARRYAELEREKPGKGFVMTIYRRRAASCPLALQRSLERRANLLQRKLRDRAYDSDLESQDIPERADPDDFPEGELGRKPSAGIPDRPEAARAELHEVEALLGKLTALGGRDSKRDVFFEKLRELLDEGRRVLVFTEFVDTMEYLRDALRPHYGSAVGCYSGAGGQVYQDGDWRPVSKAEIAQALQDGRLRILVCTDAASEGLNLQAASGLINYDLPWNPSKVEQRIGRIDRIGQKDKTVKVVNLFLKGSVDERVYTVLRRRCGLFKQFVGPMQPVLARASRMLLGEETADLQALEAAARQVEEDLLAQEAYHSSEAMPEGSANSAYRREDLRESLCLLRGAGFRVECNEGAGTARLARPGLSKLKFGLTAEALERDTTLLPLTPLTPELRQILTPLVRPGECLPLVIGAAERDGFRITVAYWVGPRGKEKVQSLEQLKKLLDGWDGKIVEASKWIRVLETARQEAERRVQEMAEQASRRELQGLRSQVEAARWRLQLALGRYLAASADGDADFNEILYRQMNSDRPGAERLRKCFELLGGNYPNWEEWLRRELKEFAQGLTEHQRKATLTGAEIDGALRDPRWAAQEFLTGD
jgi:superfamily II DNA or RNA helicase